MESNAIASGVQTFLNAEQRIAESASKIASSVASDSSGNLAEPLIDLKVAEQQATAATKIIEVEKDQVGTILDLLA